MSASRHIYSRSPFLKVVYRLSLSSFENISQLLLLWVHDVYARAGMYVEVRCQLGGSCSLLHLAWILTPELRPQVCLTH